MSKKIVAARLEEGYLVKAETEGFTYVMDYAERNPAGKSQGTSPTGLLLTALSGCHAMTARSFLAGRKIPFNKLEVLVEGDFDNGKQSWHLTADVIIKTDAQLDDRQRESMERFISRNCTVSSILQTGNDIHCSIELE